MINVNLGLSRIRTSCRYASSSRRGVAVMLMLLLGMLGPGVSAEEPVSFRAQGVASSGDTTITSTAQRAVMRAFNRENPGVRIDPFTMPAVQGGGMDSGPLMAIAAGIPPHAIYVNFRQSSTYIQQSFLEPIEILLARVLSKNPAVRQTDEAGQWVADPAAAEIADALEQLKARTPEQAWEVVYREKMDDAGDGSGGGSGGDSGGGGRHVWAVPTGTYIMALMYRKDLFYNAGLDPEQPPRDWDELLSMSRELTVPERQQFGMGIPGGQALSWGTYTFLVSNGARAVRQDEQGQWRAVYDSRAAAEAVEYLWRLAKQPFERDGQIIPGAAKIGTNELALMWERGQVAMQFAYLDDELLGDINPQLVGIAPVPVAPGGERGSELNCRMLGVYSDSTPEQKLAVMRYIWFVTSEEAQRIRTRIYVENGYGQFVSPDLLEKFGYDRLLQRVPKSWKQAFDTAMVAGVPEPYGENTQNIYRYMSAPLNRALEIDFTHTPKDEAVDRIQSLLQESVSEANLRMFGEITAESLRQRRIVAGIVVAIIALIIVIGGIHMWRHFSRAAPEDSSVSGGKLAGFKAWLLLAPALLLTFGWTYLPLSGGFALAFTDYRLVGESAFIGLDNFASVLYDREFWAGLARTFYFVTLMIGLGFWPPILLAILLDEVPTATLKYLFRTLFYLPAIISGVIIMFLWKQLYDPGEFGVLNQLLLSLNDLPAVFATVIKWIVAGVWLSLVWVLIWMPIKMTEFKTLTRVVLGAVALCFVGVTVWMLTSGTVGPGNAVGRFDLEPLRWIASPQMAMLCVVLPVVWGSAGPGCLLYLAALKTIPEDLYEAADLDGAGFWQKVCYITLPRLKFLIVIQFIAAVVGAFKGGTDYILALTGGGPNDATMILALEIFIRTFMDLRFGIGTAMAWLLGLILVGFTAYQLKMLTRAQFSAGGAKASN